MAEHNSPILRVSPDVLNAVFEYLEPRSLENAALSHSYFYSCADRLRFRIIRLTVAGRVPVLLARTLLERPQFQQHVRHLELAQAPEMNPPVPNALASPHPVLSVMDIFPFNLLNRGLLNAHLVGKGLEGISASFRQPGYAQPELLALLFSLMPNVAILKMDARLFHVPFFKGDGAPGCLNVDGYCDDCHWDDSTSGLSLLRPLRNLKTFWLDEGKLIDRTRTEPWAVEDYPEKLHHVPGMLNAGNLRHYSGIMPDSFLKILLENHDHNFAFTHLSVKMTMSDPTLLRMFLARTPHLKVLVYKHYWVSDTSTFNFEALHSALSKVKSTLEILHITTYAFHEAKYSDLMNLRIRLPTFDNLIDGNYGSLQDFTSLKTLLIPGPMLLPVREAMHSPLSSTTLSSIPTPASPLPLSNILPDALEHLTLTDCLLPLLPPPTTPSDFHVFHRSMTKFTWARQKLRLANSPVTSRLRTIAVYAKTNWLRWPEKEVMDLVRNAREEGVEMRYEDVAHGIIRPDP